MTIAKSTELTQALRSGNVVQKERAALEVQSKPRLGSRDVIEALKMCLEDRSWHVRRASALALIACLGIDAVGFVKHLLTDKAFGVRQDVADALEGLRSKK